MAYSKPNLKAQDIIFCHLCELDPKQKWKCLECQLLMCNNCYEKIHPKFQNAKDHRIIDIKDVGICRIQSSEPDFSDIKCSLHKNKRCCLYCSVCAVLICPTCIVKGHKSHEFIEIKDIYSKQLQQLQEKVKYIEIRKQQIGKQSRMIVNQNAIEVERYQKVLHAVQDQKEIWRTVGEKHA